jgi:hypothetical protein
LSYRTKSIANLKNGSHAAPDLTNARRCFSRAERFLPILGKNTFYRASGLVQCLMALLLISEFFFFGSFFLTWLLAIDSSSHFVYVAFATNKMATA